MTLSPETIEGIRRLGDKVILRRRDRRHLETLDRKQKDLSLLDIARIVQQGADVLIIDKWGNDRTARELRNLVSWHLKTVPLEGLKALVGVMDID